MLQSILKIRQTQIQPMARLIWGIGQYAQSNNAVSPFQWSAQIDITIFETEKSHYKSGKFIGISLLYGKLAIVIVIQCDSA